MRNDNNIGALIVAFGLITAMLLAAVLVLSVGSSEQRECSEWTTELVPVSELSPGFSTGSGMGMGFDGSFGVAVPSGSGGSYTMVMGTKMKEQRVCAVYATPIVEP